jgi:hypothetical protein
VRVFTVLINAPPETEIVTKPDMTTDERDSFFAWQGSDIDGTVVSFDYMLDGSGWISTDLTNATFLNLSSGNHTFRVRSVDNEGLEDPTPATFTYIILPSWCERELERLNAMVEELERRVSELEDVIANLTYLLEQSEIENTALRAAIETLEGEKAGLAGALQHLAEEKAALIALVGELESENELMEDQLSSCSNLTALLQAQIDALNQTIQQLQASNQQLQIGNNALVELVSRLRERILELEAQIPDAPHAWLVIALVALGSYPRQRKR